MDQKKKIIIVSFAFLIVGVLLFLRSGLIMLTARPVPSSFNQYPTPAPPDSTLSTPDTTSPARVPDTRTWREVFQSPIVNPEIKWKTYRNDTYGFEMQYPSDWTYEMRYGENEPVIEFSFPNVHADIYITQFSLGIQKRSKEEFEKTSFHADAFGKVSKRERMSINGVDCTLVDPDLGINVLSEVYCTKDGYIFSFGKSLGSDYPDMYAYMINTFRFTK